MPYDPQAHRQRMVEHFLWLEQRDPEYARYALETYRKQPDCPCPDVLVDVKAEKTRRAQVNQPSNPQPRLRP